MGYQSHFLEATQRGQPAMEVADRYGDELAVFEGSQTLPLFLVYTTEFGGGTSAGAESKLTEKTGPKGWSFLNQDAGEQYSGVGAGQQGNESYPISTTK